MVYHFGLRLSRKVEVWWSKSREEPGAHKQRHPINQDQIRILGKTGSTQFLSRASRPALFFEIISSDDNGIRKSDSAQLQTRRRALRGSDAFGLSPAVRTTPRSGRHVSQRRQRAGQSLDAGADDPGDSGFVRRTHRPFAPDRLRGVVARRLWHAARIVRRVLWRDRNYVARNHRG